MQDLFSTSSKFRHGCFSERKCKKEVKYKKTDLEVKRITQMVAKLITEQIESILHTSNYK